MLVAAPSFHPSFRPRRLHWLFTAHFNSSSKPNYFFEIKKGNLWLCSIFPLLCWGFPLAFIAILVFRHYLIWCSCSCFCFPGFFGILWTFLLNKKVGWNTILIRIWPKAILVSQQLQEYIFFSFHYFNLTRFFYFERISFKDIFVYSEIG